MLQTIEAYPLLFLSLHPLFFVGGALLLAGWGLSDVFYLHVLVFFH
jgi:hypothetical protein